MISERGRIFLAKEAQRIYRALRIHNEQINRSQAWQSYLETTFAAAVKWCRATRPR